MARPYLKLGLVAAVLAVPAHSAYHYASRVVGGLENASRQRDLESTIGAQARHFVPGELLMVEGGHPYRVLACSTDAGGRQDECWTDIEWRDGSHPVEPSRSTVQALVAGENAALDAQGLPRRQGRVSDADLAPMLASWSPESKAVAERIQRAQPRGLAAVFEAIGQGLKASDIAEAPRLASTTATSPTLRTIAMTPAAAAGPPARAFECWANGATRMNMNFAVTGPGSYRHPEGSGRFAVGPDGKVAFTGPMAAMMPDGFVVVYHTPGGRPTFSFRSPRGAEAAFCERV